MANVKFGSSNLEQQYLCLRMQEYIDKGYTKEKAELKAKIDLMVGRITGYYPHNKTKKSFLDKFPKFIKFFTKLFKKNA